MELLSLCVVRDDQLENQGLGFRCEGHIYGDDDDSLLCEPSLHTTLKLVLEAFWM